MADQERRFYWLKLKVNFMTSETVDFLMSQDGGANYIVLYQMLCLKTINTDGRLARQIGEVIIPFDEEKIRRDCKWFSLDTIRVAMQLYKRLGLIYEDADGTLVISDHQSLIGSEGASAQRMRKMRSKEAPLHLPEAQTPSQCDGECDGECDENVTIEIEYRDRVKEKEKKSIYNTPAPYNDTEKRSSKRNGARAGNEGFGKEANGDGTDLAGSCSNRKAESGGTRSADRERTEAGANPVRGRPEKGPLDWHDLSKDRLY